MENINYLDSIGIPVVNETINPLPEYAHDNDSGVDVRANLWDIQEKFLFNAEVVREELVEEDITTHVVKNITIHPGGRALVDTGLKVAIPDGYEIQVRPRSGLALKKGITVVNTPGTIDASYRNSIGVILINHGTEDFIVEDGDRIAQLVLAKVEKIFFIPVESLDETDRNLTGFGDSGIK